MNNQITLIGRVGQAPVTTVFTDTDNKLAKFSLAVTDYTSKMENPEPMWIDVESWNGLAERVGKTITVGREIAVSGRLSISNYTKEINGVKVEIRRPVVKLTGFHLCGPKPKTDEIDKETVQTMTTKKRQTA